MKYIIQNLVQLAITMIVFCVLYYLKDSIGFENAVFAGIAMVFGGQLYTHK